MNYNFNRNDDDYIQIVKFVSEHNNISYSQLDEYSIRKVNLFAIRENFDFQSLEKILDEIIKVLPAIKRIFAKPITRLDDISEIMPVESVKVINNRTIIHASGHSELWDDITEDGLKPKKLLTLNHQDSYVIYENIAFVKAIDIIRAIVRKNIRIIRSMMYEHRDMNFNLLERENHLEYFLAVGKLHIGYVRDYDKYRPKAERCLNKLLFIDDVIRSRLGSNVYRKCKGKTEKFSLKKTNVFRNHKDYYKIYQLLHWFSDIKLSEIETGDNGVISPDGYRLFTALITVFAVGHFNFTFPHNKLIDFYNLNLTAKFDDWGLKLDTLQIEEHSAIRFVFYKDRPYSIILIPSTDGENCTEAREKLKQKYKADEYIIASSDDTDEDQLYISLFDIESFRRIQQLLLRGMIYSDTKRDVCPFCQNPLHIEKDINGHSYVCNTCRTVIRPMLCPDSSKEYITTEIKNFKPSKDGFEGVVLRDKQLYSRQIEASLHFRNITAIKEGGIAICPHCNKSH